MFSIKNILQKVDGSRKTAEPDVAELLDLLKESQDAASEAREKLSWIANRREGLLLSDNDTQLDVDDREAEKWHRRLERAEYAIPQLQKRIAEIRERNRVALIAGWKARSRESFERNKAAFEALAEAWREDQAMRREFERAQIPELRLNDPVWKGMDLSLAFDNWLSHSEMMLGLNQPSPPDVASSRSQPRAPMKPNGLAHYTPPPAPRPKVKAPTREPFVEPEAVGMMRVQALREGIEDETRGRLVIGDVLTVEPVRARAMLNSGAFDLAAGATETSR